MINKKRIVSQIVSALLLVSMLAGCANHVSTPADGTEGNNGRFVTGGENVDETVPETEPETDAPAEPVLSEEQMNSIALYNYLAVLTQEINNSKNSRLFLEEAYAALVNNINVKNVRDPADDYLNSLLDYIKIYRMNDVKKERLDYLFNQSQAAAFKELIPDPYDLLTVISSFDKKKLVAAIVYVSIDAVSGLVEFSSEAEMEYLQEEWQFEEDQDSTLYDSRKSAFEYMKGIIQEEDLPAEWVLTEKKVEKFVDAKNCDVGQRRAFLLSDAAKKDYAHYDGYWLELAKCYYENDEYKECLDTIKEYEKVKSNVVVKDYEFAKVIPDVIAAAGEVLTGDEYISTVDNYLIKLIENTQDTDWALRYFAAEMYIDLYSRTEKEEYYNKAYSLIKDNIINVNKKEGLIGIQQSLNETYLAEVKEMDVPGDAVIEKKDRINEYNNGLKEARKTELPPIYEPLVLNLDFFFALDTIKGFTAEQKAEINGILHGGNTKLFLSDALNNYYTFDSKALPVDATFTKDSFSIPVKYLLKNPYVTINVTNDGKVSTYRGVKLSEVKRPGKDADSFLAVFKSEGIKDQKWSETSTVEIIIEDMTYKTEKTVLKFKVSKYVPTSIIHWSETVEFTQVK